MGDWLEEESVELPADPVARIVLLEGHWAHLTPKQKTFLTALGECRMNAHRAERELNGAVSRAAHKKWLGQEHYAAAFKLLQTRAAADAMDKERLLARQDHIVETLLTPKPILYQGQLTGFEEVDASAASRANEVLLDRAMPKPRADVEVNVGVAFTPPSVEVVNSAGTASDAIDASFVEVSPVLPEEDWPDEVSTDSR